MSPLVVLLALAASEAAPTPPTFHRVSGAALASGDVDGDGFDDVLVVDDDELVLHPGGPGGVDFLTAVWSVARPQVERYVRIADANADGLPDLFGIDDATDTAVLFLGTPTGWPAMPDWEQGLPGTTFLYGELFDIDGDGFLDAVLAPSASQGFLEVFGGSAAGPSAQPTYHLTHDIPSDGGWLFSTGDVDGDGLDDLMLAQKRDAGAAVVVHGTVGPPNPDLTTLPHLATYGGYEEGVPCLLPDLNGDGYGDALFPGDGNTLVLVWGSPTGLDPAGADSATGLALDRPAENATLYYRAVRVLPIDADADGDLDLLLGNEWYDSSHANEGILWLYPQGPNGLEPTASWIAQGNVRDARLLPVTVLDADGDGREELLTRGGFWEDHPPRHRIYEASVQGLGGGMPEATWQAPSPLTYAGLSLAGADLDGDGYDDLIVGASDTHKTDYDADGAIRIFRGGAGGVVTPPEHTLDGSNTGAGIHALGDIDGDGLEDVLLGASRRLFEVERGPCWVPSPYGYRWVTLDGFACPYPLSTVSVLTGATGLAGDTLARSERDFFFGLASAPAGDVDGDGAIDLLAYTSQAEVGVWLGRGDGTFDPTPAWVTPADAMEMSVAHLLAGLGDVNGDGYDDFAVADPGWRAYVQQGPGRVRVFFGGAAGPTLHIEWEGSHAEAGLGIAVKGADVNGDGFGDVLVSSLLDGGHVYLGSAGGLQALPQWSVPADDPEAYGYLLDPAGDIDGDGLDDLLTRPLNGLAIEGFPALLGTPEYEGPESVRLFLGTPNGPDTSPRWAMASGWGTGTAAAGVGDLDGDGLGDIALTGSQRLLVITGDTLLAPPPSDTGLPPTTTPGTTPPVTTTPTPQDTAEPTQGSTPDTGEPEATEGAGDEGGSGCQTAGSGGGFGVLLGLLPLLGRRRRG